MTLPHKSFLEVVLSTLQPDERFVAAWVLGSLARGTADSLSDIDLVLVVSTPHVASLCTRPRMTAAHTTPERLALFEQFGTIINLHENNYNAPNNGTFTHTMYAGPLMVDWTLLPQPGTTRPPSVLFDKVGLPPTPAPQPESLDERRAHAAEQVAFFWMMIAVTLKYVIRRDAVFFHELFGITQGALEEVQRLVEGRAWEYHRPQGQELASTSEAQIVAVQRLLDHMLALLPAVESLGVELRPAPLSAIHDLLTRARGE